MKILLLIIVFTLAGCAATGYRCMSQNGVYPHSCSQVNPNDRTKLSVN